MSGLSKDELELEINMLFKNIEVGIAQGLDTSELHKRLTLFRSDLFAFILAEDRNKDHEDASAVGKKSAI